MIDISLTSSCKISHAWDFHYKISEFLRELVFRGIPAKSTFREIITAKSLVFCGIPAKSLVFRGISAKSLVFREIPAKSLVFRGIPVKLAFREIHSRKIYVTQFSAL